MCRPRRLFGRLDQGLERHAHDARLLIENGHTTNGRENRRFFRQTPRPLGKNCLLRSMNGVTGQKAPAARSCGTAGNLSLAILETLAA